VTGSTYQRGAVAEWLGCSPLALKVPGSARAREKFSLLVIKEWVPDSLQSWGRWRRWGRGVALHPIYTTVDTSWLSNSHSSTWPSAKQQPLVLQPINKLLCRTFLRCAHDECIFAGTCTATVWMSQNEVKTDKISPEHHELYLLLWHLTLCLSHVTDGSYLEMRTKPLTGLPWGFVLQSSSNLTMYLADIGVLTPFPWLRDRVVCTCKPSHRTQHLDIEIEPAGESPFLSCTTRQRVRVYGSVISYNAYIPLRG